MIEVKLTPDEVFVAIFQYINNNYPHMRGTEATIRSTRGVLEGATVRCEYKKII